MPSSSRRVTLRDVARVAKCHFTSVSLALRNDARLPEATRKRLQGLAERMGYTPDPMLAALGSYRSALRPVGFHAALAWLTNHPTADGWRRVNVFAQYHAGAVERARSLGYRVEPFWLGQPDMSLARAAQILAARGISGIIVAPQPEPAMRIDLDWSRFCVVAIGYSLAYPRLHVVGPNQYRAIRHAMVELRLRGYQRPGLVMLAASDERVEHNWTAGYLTAQDGARRRPLPPLLLPQWKEDNFFRWLDAQAPDVILTKCDEVGPALRRWKRRTGREVGVAYLSLPDPAGELTGIYENPRRVGAAAVEYLIAMIQRGERGVPATPQQILVEASWIVGRTALRGGGRRHSTI